jgi:hypothetical protein
MEVANTLAYYDTASISAVKSFKSTEPRVNHKTFKAVLVFFLFVTSDEAE